MKICFLIISNGWSGAEKALYHLIKKNLSNSDLRLYLCVNEEIFKYYKDLKKVEIINFGKIFNSYNLPCLYNLLKFRKTLKDLLKKENIFILSSFLSLSTILTYNLNRQISVNKIFNLRGTEINNYLSNKNILNRIFIGNELKRSKILISVSNKQIKDFPEKYKKKTVVIPNGVDSDKFKPLNNIKQKKNIILFVGRIIKDKGINEILSVAKQLPEYEFWFAGKGDLSKEINLPNTKYLGEKNSDELVKLYNKATIGILPSYHEGFSNVGLETIACGRSLICTPDFSEYIKNGKDGIIIPTKDEKALKDAIVDLMTNEKKRKMLEKNARKKALQYSWDNVAKMYMKVFKEVIA